MIWAASMPGVFTNGEVMSTGKKRRTKFTPDRVPSHQDNGTVAPMRDVEFIEEMCDRFMVAWEASGLSKQAFAESVGLTGSQLTNISRYRNPPPHKTLAEAARIYGLTTDFFYTGTLGGMRDQKMADRLRDVLAARART